MLFTIRYNLPGRGGVESTTVEAASPEQARLMFKMSSLGNTEGKLKPVVTSISCDDYLEPEFVGQPGSMDFAELDEDLEY